MNPDNPFSAEPQGNIMYSKEMGQFAVENNMNPQNIFTWIRKSSRTI